ncbi:Glucan endo-1,3-beta-D-glucosidase [Bertholletia excelsa]
MARDKMAILWACSAILLLASSVDVVAGLGVNWGDQCSHNLPLPIAIQLLKDNGFDKVKLFDSQDWVVKAFDGSGIEVMVGIPNDQLETFSSSDDDANDWVKESITDVLKESNVDIKYVAVGNEPFLKTYNGSYLKTTLPAMKKIQKALDDAGHNIKVVTPLNADVYGATNAPSEGDFRRDIKNQMVELVRWLKGNNSPFVVNIYPFFSLYQDPNFPIDFAFFDGNSTTIKDGKYEYTNVLDANLDTLVWSLKKAGVEDLGIIVGEVGWPTDGAFNADVKMAKRFYDGLMKKVVGKKGSPLMPQGPMEWYLYSLLDENMKNIAPGNFERHWGIFKYDGKPKFEVDLTGQGRNVMPVGAKGVEYMIAVYCVVNQLSPQLNNEELLAASVDYACAAADCTALAYGSSCNTALDKLGNITYAFNIYYQMNNQQGDACNFNGMGTVTVFDPLVNTSCPLSVQIKSKAHSLHLHVYHHLVLAALLVFLGGPALSSFPFL